VSLAEYSSLSLAFVTKHLSEYADQRGFPSQGANVDLITAVQPREGFTHTGSLAAPNFRRNGNRKLVIPGGLFNERTQGAIFFPA
jgi:hypothetical protein